MADEPQKPERRTYVPKTTRAKRMAGGSVGTAIAVVITWGLSNYGGVQMPAEVSAAVGGIITWALVCLDDMIAIFWNRRAS